METGQFYQYNAMKGLTDVSVEKVLMSGWYFLADVISRLNMIHGLLDDCIIAGKCPHITQYFLDKIYKLSDQRRPGVCS